jgi:beta-glucosidase
MDLLDSVLSLEEKLSLTAGQDMWSTHAAPHAGISSVRFADGPMGITGGRVDERDVALLTPCGVALGASWDRDLVQRIGALVGDEAIRIGVQAVLGPNLNLPRSPLAGRAFELFSEDPQLTAELGSQWIAGVQARGVAAVAKHVVCNDSETDRRNMNSVVDEATIREVYLWPFEYAARHGVWAMLTAYNRVNGVPCAEHAQVLRTWLKNELSWDGLITSDWFGTRQGLASLEAGLDLEMPGPPRHMGSHLGLIGNIGDASNAIDDANVRLRRLSDRVSHPLPYPADQLAITARIDLLEEAAAAGFVLLRNDDNLLPLKLSTPSSLAVIGPNATVPCYQGGTFAKVAVSPDAPLPIEAIQEQFCKAGWQVEHALGVSPDYRLPPLTVISPRSSSGESGLDVSFFSDKNASQPVHKEIRNTTSMVWFKDMPGIGNLLKLENEARIEACTVFIPGRSGSYRFCIGGTALASLRINDEDCLSYDGQAVSGDIMGKLMQSEYACVDRFLVAGNPVTLTFNLSFGPSIAHGLWFGCQPPQDENLLEQAVELAERSDNVVLMVGETADAGLESVDRDTTCLPAAQIELIKRVCAVNPNTVVVINAAHAIDTEFLSARALLMAWYPGQQFAPALAKVLTGEREPGGRLPVTLAKQESDYPAWSLQPDVTGNLHYHEAGDIGYRHFVAQGKPTAFCFGHGLGYTEFDYRDSRLIGSRVEQVAMEVTLQNVGSRGGKETVQIYLMDPAGQTRLAGFSSAWLDEGEGRRLQVDIHRHAFERWSAGGWVLSSGTYQIQLGRSIDDERCRLAVVVSSEGDVNTL